MKNTFRKILNLGQKTYSGWTKDKASLLAAALAYYTVFSLAPLLMISISLASLIWTRDVIETQVFYQLQNFLGSKGAMYIQTVISNLNTPAGGGLLVNLVGIATLLFGAIGVFRQLRNAMNTIWDVTHETKKGFWKPVKRTLLNNLFSFTMVIGLGILFIVLILINIFLSAVSRYTLFLPFSDVAMDLVNNGLTFGLTTLIFTLLFKFIPDVWTAWKHALIGGFVTAVLFTLGKFGINLYLANSSVISKFGPAGSLVLLLVWVYYSAQIFFLGAEFTHAYAETYGNDTESGNNSGE